MRRRILMSLPGIAALAATRAFSQTQDVTAPGQGAVTRVSHKALTKHGGLKSAYKVPKSANKQTKYVNSLTALLSLTPTQQQQAAVIFTSGAATMTSIRGNLKTTRQSLSQAVHNNDMSGIAQASAALGALTGQYVSSGALAHAAFLQLLTRDQQTRLSQFQN